VAVKYLLHPNVVMDAQSVERQGLNIMKKVKKMAFGGIGRALKSAVKPAVKPPVGGPMGSAMTDSLARGLNKRNVSSATKPGLKLVDPIMGKSAAPTKISPSGGLAGALKNATAQTSKPGTPPPTVMPAGMNPMAAAILASNKGRTPSADEIKLNAMDKAINTPKVGNAFSDKKVTRNTGAPSYSAMKKGGKVSSASKRADGCAIKGKTRGRMV
jgi:hypothetical protein